MPSENAWFAFKVRDWFPLSACLSLNSEGLYLRLSCLAMSHGDGRGINIPRDRLLTLLRIDSAVFGDSIKSLIDVGAVVVDGDEIQLPMVAASEEEAERRREKWRLQKKPAESGGIQKTPRDMEWNGRNGIEGKEEKPIQSLAQPIADRIEPNDEAWPKPHRHLEQYPRWWKPDGFVGAQLRDQRRFVEGFEAFGESLITAFQGTTLKPEFDKAYAWEEANKAKTPKGRKRFIYQWIERAHNRGGMR